MQRQQAAEYNTAGNHAGDKPPVDLETLEEALEYTKYAVAVYAVQTLTDRPDRR